MLPALLLSTSVTLLAAADAVADLRCRAEPYAADRALVLATLHRPRDWEKVPSRSNILGPFSGDALLLQFVETDEPDDISGCSNSADETIVAPRGVEESSIFYLSIDSASS